MKNFVVVVAHDFVHDRVVVLCFDSDSDLMHDSRSFDCVVVDARFTKF